MKFHARAGFSNGFVPRAQEPFWVNIRDDSGTWGVRLTQTGDPDPSTGMFPCVAQTLVPNAADETLVPGARVPIFRGSAEVGHLVLSLTVTASDFAA